MSKEIFAKRLVELREKNGVSQAELAKHLGVSRQSLSLYETAERTINIDLLEQIAKYFDVSADYLLGISNASSVDIDMQAICKTIGCSEPVVNVFRTMYGFGLVDPDTFPPPQFLDEVFTAEFSNDEDFSCIMMGLFDHVRVLVETNKTFVDLTATSRQPNPEDHIELLMYKVKRFEENADRRDASEWRLMKAFSEFAEALADKYIKKQVK